MVDVDGVHLRTLVDGSGCRELRAPESQSIRKPRQQEPDAGVTVHELVHLKGTLRVSPSIWDAAGNAASKTAPVIVRLVARFTFFGELDQWPQ